MNVILGGRRRGARHLRSGAAAGGRSCGVEGGRGRGAAVRVGDVRVDEGHDGEAEGGERRQGGWPYNRLFVVKLKRSCIQKYGLKNTARELAPGLARVYTAPGSLL